METRHRMQHGCIPSGAERAFVRKGQGARQGLASEFLLVKSENPGVRPIGCLRGQTKAEIDA